MTALGPAVRRLARTARAAVLIGCLSLLTAQQFGHGTSELLDAFLFRQTVPATHALKAASHTSHSHALGCDRLAPICEAVLTERRTRVSSSAGHLKPTQPQPTSVFHNNYRPVVLRSRAIFCDFAALRRILHPHLTFLANTVSVLC